MDKFGVVIDEDTGKTASDKGKCPECGRDLVKDSNVPKSPVHGTKQFERG